MPEDNLLNDVNASAESFVDKWVGEGKKFKTVEELAKSYENADKHIATMNNDNSHLREEFEQFRELATKQLANATNPPRDNLNVDQNDQNRQQTPAATVPPKGNVEEVDLDKRIAQKLDEQEEQRRLAENAKRAEEVMIVRFGSKEAAQEAIRKRAQELEVSPQWLANSAFQSPNAFFASMGINPTEVPRSTSTPGSQSDVDVGRLANANPGVQPGTYEYFQEIRRKDPGKYFSSEVQQALMAAAMQANEQGRDFYKR